MISPYYVKKNIGFCGVSLWALHGDIISQNLIFTQNVLCHCLIFLLEKSEIYILRIVDCASRGSTSSWALQLLVLGALLISLRPELLRAPPSLQITFWGKNYKKLFCRKKIAQELNSSFLQLLNCFTTLLLQHYYLHHKYRP